MTDRIKFSNDDKIYEVMIHDINGQKEISFVNNDRPNKSVLSSGFYVFSTNGLVCGKYVKHNYLKLNEDGTVLLSDSEIQEQPDMETEPELPPIYELTLEDVKSNKISQLSSECRKQIVGGVDVLIDNAAEHFSYTVEDQMNIKSLFDAAISTGCSVPYHSDGNVCKEYSAAQIADIYAAQQINLIKNTTYFNMMRAYISSIHEDDMLEAITALRYGDPLPENYVQQYQQIISNAMTFLNMLNQKS